MSEDEETTKLNLWWLASTSFPVLAGALCAMAVMFNVCTVSQAWQEAVDIGGRISTLSQPPWAIALKAVSLALATIAYFVLLLTMMSKRDPVKGFTVTIMGWLASATILLSLIGVVVRQHPIVQPQQSLEYTQNFFYGILAAGLYILIAILLAIYTASAHTVRLSHKDRQTVECTSIILRTITFMVFLLGGAAVYSSIEGWSFMDALYFTDYTLLTIGIGNFAPKTHLGRSLLFLYATIGIIALGLVISSIASFEKNMRRMKLRFKLKEARINMHEREDARECIDIPRNSNEKQSTLMPASAQFPSRSEVLKVHRIKSDFYRRRRWIAFLLFLVAWFVLWLCSAIIFRRTERSQGWSYFEALYFTYTSLTTIGYGDLYPTSNFGKVFFVFWSLLAIPILTNLVTAMGEIGLRTLTDFSGYMWRVGVSRALPRQHHQHQIIRRSHGERGGNGLIKSPLDPESLRRGANIERYTQESSTTRQSTKEVQRFGTKTSSGGNESELSKSMNEAVKHELLLAEEIEKLVAALRDESIKQDRCCDWTRTLSLLHAGEDEGPSSLEPGLQDYAQIATRKPMSSEKAAADRDSEILWMLKFLAEKLCSDLREELYKET